MCQHKRILDFVGGEKYNFEINPYLKNSNDMKFAIALNNGKPVVIGSPTHTVNVKWSFWKENYTTGHKCYSMVSKDAEMTLAISNQGCIDEHSYCKNNSKKLKSENVELTKIQLNEIKRHILEQKQFSRLKARIFIMKKYKYKSNEAKQALKQACDKL